MSTSDIATLSSHLVFLTDAAHLLARASPETSAYLMRCRNGIMFANDLDQSDTQKQHVCGACGHIIVLGQGSALKMENDLEVRAKERRRLRSRNKSRQPAGRERRPGPAKTLTCGHCNRYTKVPLPSPGPISRKKVHSHSAPSLPPSSASRAVEAQKQAANASSKKRAKARKAGLQALINQSQASRKSGLGLSLADFMKK